LLAQSLLQFTQTAAYPFLGTHRVAARFVFDLCF
jgi:hypothetical protein